MYTFYPFLNISIHIHPFSSPTLVTLVDPCLHEESLGSVSVSTATAAGFCRRGGASSQWPLEDPEFLMIFSWISSDLMKFSWNFDEQVWDGIRPMKVYWNFMTCYIDFSSRVAWLAAFVMFQYVSILLQIELRGSGLASHVRIWGCHCHHFLASPSCRCRK